METRLGADRKFARLIHACERARSHVVVLNECECCVAHGWQDKYVAEVGSGAAWRRCLLFTRLLTEANVLMLVDLPNTLLQFARLILGTGALPIPVRAEQLEPLQLSASYAGMSLAASGRRLQVRTMVPVETYQGFVQIGMFVQGLMRQAR